MAVAYSLGSPAGGTEEEVRGWRGASCLWSGLCGNPLPTSLAPMPGRPDAAPVYDTCPQNLLLPQATTTLAQLLDAPNPFVKYSLPWCMEHARKRRPPPRWLSCWTRCSPRRPPPPPCQPTGRAGQWTPAQTTWLGGAWVHGWDEGKRWRQGEGEWWSEGM